MDTKRKMDIGNAANARRHTGADIRIALKWPTDQRRADKCERLNKLNVLVNC